MHNLKKGIIIASMAVLFASGCSSMKDENPLTGEKEFNSATKNAAIGATGGAAIGALGGGVGAAVGAVVGGVAGGYYGYNLDQARHELRDELEDFGIEVTDINGVIHIKMANDLLFNKSDDNVSKDGALILNKFLKIVKELDESNYIKISGHTDNTGDRKYNISLSEQRAKKVAFYLYENGIPAKQIDYIGYADMMPIASNDTEEGMQKNRRVTIEIIPAVVKY